MTCEKHLILTAILLIKTCFAVPIDQLNQDSIDNIESETVLDISKVVPGIKFFDENPQTDFRKNDQQLPVILFENQNHNPSEADEFNSDSGKSKLNEKDQDLGFPIFQDEPNDDILENTKEEDPQKMTMIHFGEPDAILLTDNKTENVNDIRENVPNEDLFVFPTFRPSIPTSSEKPRTDSGIDLSIRNAEECDVSMGLVSFQGQCERVLARASCGKDEWLVVTEDKIECKKRSCEWGLIFYKNNCVNLTNFSVCAPGQMLYLDFEGNAECDCEPSFHYMPWTGECIPEHEKGQCNFGEYIELSKTTGMVECVRNPCIMDSYVYDEKSKKCYKKLYRGKCDARLHIDSIDRTAECLSLQGHNIFEVPTLRSCPNGSKRDYLHRCRRSFKIPTQRSSPSFFGRCPHSFTKDKSGNCKKLVSLFS